VKARAVLVAVLREARAARGRLVFFTACLAIGVAAVVGVSALVAAIESSLRAESRDLLAADLRVSARRALPEELVGFFAGIPHERTDVTELAALASAGAGKEERSRLVELKVVSGRYPFYGTLVLDPPASGEDALAALGDDAVYVAPEALAGLGIGVGGRVSIGGAGFRVAAAVLDEPDRLDFALTLGPRVFLSAAGFERTDLGGAQNRVQHRALYKLEGDRTHAELERLEDDIERAVSDASWIRVATHTEAQPTVRRALGRVEDYLGLVALLSLLLGGVGVSQIVRAWLAGRTQAVAVMRCLGFRAREVAAVYLGNVAVLALVGCLVGGALGAMLPWGVRALAPELFQGGGGVLLQPWAIARGVGLGLLIALIFCLPPLTAVWRVPPAAVLRAEAVPLPAPRAVRFGAPLLLGLGVLWSAHAQGGEWLHAWIFAGGLLALTGCLWGGARLAMVLSSRAARRGGGRLGPTLQHGLAALGRPGEGTTGAVVALGLGVLVVLAMLLVQRELDRALREALPENAPSVFLVDVQRDQWDGVKAALEAEGARSIDAVPVLMARLRAIGGETVEELSRSRRPSRQGGRGRGRWVLTREQRLTWRAELPPDNAIVAGALWSEPELDEVSLEEGYAEDLGVTVGDTLSFDVQGIDVELAVTSIRTVDWASFAINFFLVVEPGVLDDAPHMQLAAARVEPPEAELALQNRIARDFPNVTMLRVRPILEKLAAVLARIALGVRALGAFTILTGLVILAGAVGATALRRAREAALLKTLGLTRAGVTRLFAVEYALVGLAAGAIGAAGALVLAQAFLAHVLELSGAVPWIALPLAALATAALATVSGLAASVRALHTRPMETLRSA
jgi:putative ABC transport system permease protein